MPHLLRRSVFLLTFSAAIAFATSVPRLSFEELTDNSDFIVAGHIVKSWTAWDTAHKYIWTHYELAVQTTPKRAPAATVEFAEPGGSADGVVISIPGTVTYVPGESVLVFLQKMPNGYLRTSGWGQGKYNVDAKGALHGDSMLRGVDLIGPGTPASAPATRLDGLSVKDASARITSRLAATASHGRAN